MTAPGSPADCSDVAATAPRLLATIRRNALGFLGPVLCALTTAAPAATTAERAPAPGERAAQTLARMSRSREARAGEGRLGAPWGGAPKPVGAIGSAGFVRRRAAARRAGRCRRPTPNSASPIPATSGAATARPPCRRILSLASTWDEALARRQGEAVASEARARGFNLLLGGAVNLIRDPRGGRNFEYFSEDPLLSGMMAGATVAGAQSQHVLTTVKHFALNDQETDRGALDARIDPAAARESDLLAFEIAIERGKSRRGHVRLQPGQRRLCLREPLAARRRAERRLALSRASSCPTGARRIRRSPRRSPGSTRSRARSSTRATFSARRWRRRSPTARRRRRGSTTWRGAS